MSGWSIMLYSEVPTSPHTAHGSMVGWRHFDGTPPPTPCHPVSLFTNPLPTLLVLGDVLCNCERSLNTNQSKASGYKTIVIVTLYVKISQSSILNWISQCPIKMHYVALRLIIVTWHLTRNMSGQCLEQQPIQPRATNCSYHLAPDCRNV